MHFACLQAKRNAPQRTDGEEGLGDLGKLEQRGAHPPRRCGKRGGRCKKRDSLLLVAQGVDRIERRGLERGIQAERNAHGRAESRRQQDRLMMMASPSANPAPRCDAGGLSEVPRTPRGCRRCRRAKTRTTASIENTCISDVAAPCAPDGQSECLDLAGAVRSPLTSMIFMMPMPPTMSETQSTDRDERAGRSRLLSVAVAISAISSWLRTEQSSSWPGRICYWASWRRSILIWLSTWPNRLSRELPPRWALMERSRESSR